ncbi:MAG: hypothetical protein ACYS18_09390 [Planctomycetota bacterium]
MGAIPPGGDWIVNTASLSSWAELNALSVATTLKMACVVGLLAGNHS